MARELNVLVTGASGQLGRALRATAPSKWRVTGLSHQDVDVRDWHATRDAIAFEAPDVVVHAAAATDVDGCERAPDFAYQVNAIGTRNTAVAAKQVEARLVFLSTNFVFDGEKDSPYHEFDDPNPISTYGASKLAEEREGFAASPATYV
ncbi:MAG: SDR family oxidoreductase, partial [Chloroflexota bacterium]